MPGEVGIVLLGTLLCVAGQELIYAAPAFLDAMASRLRLTASQVGLLSGLQMLAITGAAILTGLGLHRVRAPAVCLVLLTCLLGNLALTLPRHFGGAVTLVTLTALLGEGPAFALGFVVLAKSARPERAFGIAYTGLAVTGAAALQFQPELDRVLPVAGTLLPIGVAALVLLCLLPRLLILTVAPRGAAPRAGEPRVGWRIWTLLFSVAIWTSAPVTMWSFAALAAAARSLSGPAVSHALSVATLSGVIGSVLPALLGKRRPGDMVMIALGTAGLIAGTLLAFASSTTALLAGGLALACICWNVTNVYQLTLLSVLDGSGRAPALCAPAQLLGSAAGPPLGGVLITSFGYGALAPLVAMLASVGVAITLFGLRQPARGSGLVPRGGTQPDASS